MQRPLEIALLRIFVMLVEERSVTRVAQRLHRTQPAVSLQIRRLEDAVGRPLFESNLRHLRLSTRGVILLSAIAEWPQHIGACKGRGLVAGYLLFDRAADQFLSITIW